MRSSFAALAVVALTAASAHGAAPQVVTNPGSGQTGSASDGHAYPVKPPFL